MKLFDYIKSSRRGKDAYRLERQAMDDPFLADALEGLDSVEGDHIKQIEELQRRLTKRLQPKTYHFRTWSIAASILICISIGGYFIVRQIQNPDLFAVKNHTEEANSPENQEIAYNEILDTLSIYMPEKEARRLRTESREDFPMLEEQMEKMPISIATLPVSSAESAKSKESIVQSDSKNKSSQVTIRGVSSISNIVRGTVVDEHGEPLAGVSVTQKGTPQGAVTDANGNFSFKANNNNPLEAKYLGYESKEFSVNTSAPMYIAMNEDVQRLDEVVVTGYGSKKEPNMTGSVSSVKDISDVKPSPLMGMRAYQRDLQDRMIRPKDAVCGDKKGTVILEFNVDAKGTPININVKKSLCVSMDIEAIRLLQQGPKWTVGSQTVELKVKF